MANPEHDLTQPPALQAAFSKALVADGVVTPAQLMRALRMQARSAGDLGAILIAQGAVTAEALAMIEARQQSAARLPVQALQPDVRLVDLLGAHRCLALMCLPVRRLGGLTLVACARPADFAAARVELEQAFGPVQMAIVTEAELSGALARLRLRSLRDWAQSCVAPNESCRTLGGQVLRQSLSVLAVVFGAALVAWPLVVLQVLTGIAVLMLILSGALKLLAVGATLRARLSRSRPARREADTKPVISVLVPMYKEPETLPRLINRLNRLTWPRHLLDILLVVEETDSLTRGALAEMTLPAWMRVIVVPDAPLRTKPRALNYAMLFARGSVIGVYDAEDAPEPDQLHRVAQAFAEGPDTLACVQGLLDFYNPQTNWIARCFTIEYASWFRVILPGLQRMGLVVPLGGTTLFFRAEALRALGGWDAHNVTEDADLGLRLARRGYTMQILPSVTYEEANCRALPWVKQRSRWLKGYAITWATHMRNPAALWRDLGPKRFFGVQVLFLGTLVQFALMPLLWSFWIIQFGFGHPLLGEQPAWVFQSLLAVFLVTEAITLSVGLVALRARHHRGLIFWLPAMHVYFPLAVLAVYKALWELIRAPFYWDKTTHGDHAASLDACIVQAHN